MRDAVVSIAAGASQLPLLEAARRLGLATIAVDRDPHAPGMRAADAALVASSHDAEAVLRGLAELECGLRPVAVATKSSGPPVTTCARVAAALGLPGLNPELAEAAAEKPGQLALCERAGVPVPRHARLRRAGELAERGLEPPLVCKPVRTRVGKRGVRLARNAAEVRPAFEAARAESADGTVEVEAYLPGRDVVLAGLFRDSRFRAVALLDEDARFLGAQDVRGLGFALPSTLAGTPLEAVLVGHAARLVERNALGTGVLFATFRVLARRGEARVLELHFDLAGDLLAEGLFPAACDFPLIEATLELLAGRALRERAVRTSPAVLRFVRGDDVVDGDVLARLRALPEVLACEVRLPLPGPDERAGHVLARGGAEVAARIDRLLGRARSGEPLER